MKKLVLMIATFATVAAVLAAPAEARGLHRHGGAGTALAAATIAATVADTYVYGPGYYYGPAPVYYGVPLYYGLRAGW